MTKLKEFWNKFIYKILLPFLVVHVFKNLLRFLFWTCKWKIEGLDLFVETASKEKTLLMLWHNRLVIAPYFLNRFTNQLLFSAFISNSRDGELISSLVESYKIGKTIRVGHQKRHEALRQLIQVLEEAKEVVVITPDGPRGPVYQIKPGAALAALETSAHIFMLNWNATRSWEMKTWDRLKIPKPFSTIRISLKMIPPFKKEEMNLQTTKETLQQALYEFSN